MARRVSSRAEGAGAATVLRAVAAVTTRTPSPEVLGLGRIDVLHGDGRFDLDSLYGVAFPPPADDGPAPFAPLAACTPLHVAEVVWAPRRPDVLVVHDLPAAQRVFAPPLLRGLPLLDVGRVARALWHGAPAESLDRLVDWRGLRTVVRTYLGAAPPMPAAVAALMTALMLVDLLGSDGAHCGLPAAAGRNDAWLGAVLGDLAGAPVLQAMLDVTAACAEPLRYAPAPWDDEEDWRLVPLADLRWHAERGGGDWTRAAARAELCRRRAAVVREAGEPRARVLLRRGARQAP